MEEVALERVEGLQTLPVQAMKAQITALHDLMREVLTDGTDYGTIPGTNKPTLYKAGAEKIMTYFRLDPQFEVVNMERDDDFILYDVRCTIFSINSGARLGSGLGSCNSNEEKYKWRKAHDEEYTREAEDRKRLKVVPKRDGTHFLVKQVRVNPYDLMNTIEKMACKRALVAATLVTTSASAIFTQDLEDSPRQEPGDTPPDSGDSTGASSRPATKPMIGLIQVLYGKRGPDFRSDSVRHEHAEITLTGLTGKEVKIASFNDLTFDQARLLIDALQKIEKGEQE